MSHAGLPRFAAQLFRFQLPADEYLRKQKVMKWLGSYADWRLASRLLSLARPGPDCCIDIYE